LNKNLNGRALVSTLGLKAIFACRG